MIWSGVLAVSTQLAIIGRMSSDYVAAASIASVAQQFVMIIVYSMAKSATITTGKAVGQGDYERVKQIGRTFLVLSAFCGYPCVWRCTSHSNTCTIVISKCNS